MITSLKRIASIEQSLAYAAGYGIKYYLMVQDLPQLTAAYGRDENIMGNAHIRIAFAPNKLETAEMLSKMTGISTVIKDQVSLSGRAHRCHEKRQSFATRGITPLTNDRR